MSAVGVSVNNDGRKTRASFSQQRVHPSQHADTGTARNDRGQLRGQKVGQSLRKESARGCWLHRASGKVEFRTGCLETLLPARGNSPVAAAPLLSSASPARGAQPQWCRLSLRAREQPSRLPTQHLLPQDKGSLPLASIDPTFPTLMENMVILRKRA